MSVLSLLAGVALQSAIPAVIAAAAVLYFRRADTPLAVALLIGAVGALVVGIARTLLSQGSNLVAVESVVTALSLLQLGFAVLWSVSLLLVLSGRVDGFGPRTGAASSGHEDPDAPSAPA
jgi:hypothetical protein